MKLASRRSAIRCVAMLCAVLGLSGYALSPAAAQSFTDKLGNWFFGKSSTPSNSNPNPGGPAADVDCPGVSVRQGAATLSVTEPGAEASPMTTRYQVSIVQTARECALLGGMMTMKVGVEGRVLLGPVGAAGALEVPLRMAVVIEGPEPKTVLSKFYRVPVTIQPGQTSVPFVQVEQDLSFPAPRSKDFDAYIVYVGFDPQSLATKPERKVKAKPKKRTQ